MPRRFRHRAPRRRYVRAGLKRPSRLTKTGISSAVGKYKTKVFNNRVKNAMRGLMEVKETYEQGNINILPYDTANRVACDSTNVFDYQMALNQGTGQSNRIANIVTMKSCITRYIITCAPSTLNPDTQVPGSLYPTVVKLIWFYDREDPTNFPTPYQNNNFLQLGNSSQGFQGDLSDVLYRYNTDRYRIVATRTHKMGYSSYNGVTGTGTGATAYGLGNNNDSKMFVKGSINLTKYILKKQKYNDNLATAMGRKLYCVVLSVAQGGFVLASTQVQNRLEYETIYKFTDA